MPSNTPKGRRPLFSLTSTALLFALCACATPIETTRAASNCATLVPDDWRKGVEGAALPGPDTDTGGWIAKFDEQTGNLDDANGRTRMSIDIVEKCEARDAALVKALTKPLPWWMRVFQ